MLLAVAALIAGCTIGDGGTSPGGAGPSAEASPVAVVTQNPAAGAVDVSPVAPISVTVTDGTLREIALTNPDGKLVQGELALEQASYTITEPLGYGSTYTWTGKTVPVDGSFTTVTPDSRSSVSTNIGDGQEVGIAAPIILKFDSAIEDKAAVEQALTVTTNPATPGAWAWLPDDGGSRCRWSRNCTASITAAGCTALTM